jgi:hypothetical protein
MPCGIDVMQTHKDHAMDIPRIEAETLHDRLTSHPGTLLVLAYDDDQAFSRYGVKEAIPLSRLDAQLARLGQDDGIVFYCA